MSKIKNQSRQINPEKISDMWEIASKLDKLTPEQRAYIAGAIAFAEINALGKATA